MGVCPGPVPFATSPFDLSRLKNVAAGSIFPLLGVLVDQSQSVTVETIEHVRLPL